MPAAETVEHRRALGLVAGAVTGEVNQILRTANTTDIDRWWQRRSPAIEQVVAQGFATSVGLASRYLVAHAETAGVAVQPITAEADPVQTSEGLRLMGPVAFKSHLVTSESVDAARRIMVKRTLAESQRLTLLGSRRTIMNTVAQSDSIVGFRRITRPGACDFCTMLAGRGAVFKNRDTAAFVAGRRGRPRGTRRIGQSYHSSCRCTPEPVHG